MAFIHKHKSYCNHMYYYGSMNSIDGRDTQRQMSRVWDGNIDVSIVQQ